MDTPQTERLLTVRDLARRLAIGQGTIRKMAKAGRVPALRVGGRLRFRWLDVVAALRLTPAQKAVPA